MLATELFLDGGHLKVELYPKAAFQKNYPSKWFYTISVTKDLSRLADVVSGYVWTRGHEDINSALLIGDSLFRITLEINEGLSESDAAEHAKEASEKYLAAFCSSARETYNIVPGQIFRTSALRESACYEKCFAEIIGLYSQSAPFRVMVRADAVGFVDRQARRSRLNIAQRKAEDLSTTYLLEEISIYLMLAKQGWLCDVYLGHEVPTLKKIMAGNIPEAPAELKNRMNVSLDRWRNLSKSCVS